MNPSYSRKHFKQQGFLLLEYLVALALFVMILLYGDSIFALHSRVKKQIEMQHNHITKLRQIALQLQPMVAQAGYTGCQNIKSIYIETPEILEDIIADDTDVLIIEQVGDWTLSLKKTMETPNDPLVLPFTNDDNNTEGWFMIDDCDQAELFYAYITHDNDQTIIQPTQPLKKSYPEKSIISPWEKIAIYLREDYTLQQKSLLPEESSFALHESIDDYQLLLTDNTLEINLTLSKEEFTLWFGY